MKDTNNFKMVRIPMAERWSGEIEKQAEEHRVPTGTLIGLILRDYAESGATIDIVVQPAAEVDA